MYNPAWNTASTNMSGPSLNAFDFNNELFNNFTRSDVVKLDLGGKNNYDNRIHVDKTNRSINCKDASVSKRI